MRAVDQRQALARLIEERGEDYAGLSRLLGRNPAYIQQFIKRGSPRRLDEKDRQTLAHYFGVSDQALGGHTAGGAINSGLVQVPRLDIGASAGPGALPGNEFEVAAFGFSQAWLRRLGTVNSSRLSVISVKGDSMDPTLSDGDDILVNHADAAEGIRDGIYVLRRDDVLMVKRIAINPAPGRVTIRSDNPAYPEWRDCDLASLDIIGRVVWTGRRVS